MAKKRIADLSAVLSADTREYEEGMRRAAKATGDTQSSITKTMGKLETVGLKLGLGLVGGGGALSMLTSEIRSVIENIDKIPGIPATTVASIQQAKYAFQEARGGVDQAIAGVVSFTSWIARAAGFAAGALVHGLDAAEQGYWDMANAASRAATEQERQAAAAKKSAEESAAAARIIAYATSLQDKTIADGAAAFANHQKAKEAYDRREETNIQKMIRLRKEANDTFNSIMPGSKDGPSIDDQARAYEKLTEVHKLEQDLTKAAQEHLDVWNEFQATIADAGITEAIENNREYAKDMKDSMVYFADGVESFLDDAIARGKDFGDVISDLGNSIVATFLKLSVVNPLMNSIFGGAKGWTALPTLFGFADGGRPPVGRASLVGERGPELFIPDTAGTVVPNHELGGGGDSFSFTYNFASGVQRSEIMPMLKMQERSIISRIVDAQRRGKQLSPAY